MKLKTIEQDSEARIIKGTESICYVKDGVVCKVFNDPKKVAERLDVIDYFLNHDIPNTPRLYDYIYDEDIVVGYTMKNYQSAEPLSKTERLKLLKQRCQELIEIYKRLKDESDLCYIDFNRENVYVNNNGILLLDIDSCLPRTDGIEQISTRYLKEYIISLIYKINYFEQEIYYTYQEREKIRRILLRDFNGNNIKTLEDISAFVKDVSKHDVKKVLKKIPYKIN